MQPKIYNDNYLPPGTVSRISLNFFLIRPLQASTSHLTSVTILELFASSVENCFCIFFFPFTVVSPVYDNNAGMCVTIPLFLSGFTESRKPRSTISWSPRLKYSQSLGKLSRMYDKMPASLFFPIDRITTRMKI